MLNSHHFGAAGYYAAMAPKARPGRHGDQRDAHHSVVPTRARCRPARHQPDRLRRAGQAQSRRSCSTWRPRARPHNKVKVYGLNDKPLPAGWVLDDARPAGHRRPTRPGRSSTARKKGGLTPLGGTAEMSSHKGYGLALMAHILGGTLSGASFSPIRIRTQKPSDPDHLGHFFMAIDPDAFRDAGEFEDDLDAVIDVLHETPPVDPAITCTWLSTYCWSRSVRSRAARRSWRRGPPRNRQARGRPLGRAPA